MIPLKLVRHARAARERWLTVLYKCIHCSGHSLGLTAAAYNHSVDRQRFESTSLVTLPVYVPFMLRLDGASMGGYSWLVRHARRARERLPTRRSQIISL